MAQCFAESKHLNTGNLDMHSSGCNGRIHSSQVAKGHVAHVHNFRSYPVANQAKVATYGDADDNSRKEGGSIRGYGSFNMGGLYEKVEPRQVARTRLATSMGSHSKSVRTDGTGGCINPILSRGGVTKSRVEDSSSELSIVEDRRNSAGAMTVDAASMGEICNGDKLIVAKSIAQKRFLSKNQQRGENVPLKAGSVVSSAAMEKAPLDAGGISASHCYSIISSSSAAIGDASEIGKSKSGDGLSGNCQSPAATGESYGGENSNSGKLVVGNGNFFKSQKLNQVLLRENSVADSSANTGPSKASEGVVAGTISDRLLTSSNLRKEKRSGEMNKDAGSAVNSPVWSPRTAAHVQANSPRTDIQSWPSSPASLRAVVRTRNLSEGSFNLIFAGVNKEGNVNEPRSHAGSPRKGSSRDWNRGVDDSEDISTVSSFRDCLLSKQAQMSQARSNNAFSTSTEVNFPRSGTLTPDCELVGLPSQASLRDRNGLDTRTREHQTKCDASSSIKFPKEQPCDTPRTTHSSNAHSTTSFEVASLYAASDSSRACTRQSICTSQNRDRFELRASNVGNQTAMAGYERSPTTGIITGGSFGRSEIGPAINAIGSSKAVSKQGVSTSAFGNITNGSKLTTAQSSYGNVIKDNPNPDHQKDPTEAILSAQKHLVDEMRRGLSSMDPDEVKSIGNEYYRKGRISEALSLYDRAIALLPGQAAFHSNRAAALAALGRLGDAVQECQEAIKIDSFYSRAHQRLASLFIRLGRIGDAKRHLKAAGNKDERVTQSSDIIEGHVKKCFEARHSKDWLCMIKESDAAVVAGADSAPQIFALKAEALLKLGKIEEAIRVMSAAQRLEITVNTRKHTLAHSIVYVIQAKIDLALGKFEEAITTVEKAVKMEPANIDAAILLKKARTIGRLRATGNELFKAGKYFEASAAYGEGLEVDPVNAVLLCNRAACRSNLGLWEKAIEDCNAALAVQPNYKKARLRRAHSNAKLEKWEEALRDYEILRRELPGNLEVAQALFDVQVSLKKSRGEETFTKRFGEVDVVYSSEQFREAISSPVVHFTLRSNDRCIQISKLIGQLCKQYPAVNFIKVDIEENPYLAKMENVNFVPTCKMYKNGLKVKESIELSHQALEQAVQLCIH
ncbi:hypothetical protein O6H91_15G042700 [Diphasiastrum complanatum]|uniref:Uncharacterized protein n=1 Tax=Diphasiastrum complanatum TaxID=34168 RepID=A0ACC2BIP5_DIPCM|nr:hypothetical protein O6H91_15G042700 [Diphasiastrum complanatum]